MYLARKLSFEVSSVDLYEHYNASYFLIPSAKVHDIMQGGCDCPRSYLIRTYTMFKCRVHAYNILVRTTCPLNGLLGRIFLCRLYIIYRDINCCYLLDNNLLTLHITIHEALWYTHYQKIIRFTGIFLQCVPNKSVSTPFNLSVQHSVKAHIVSLRAYSCLIAIST